MTMAEQYRETRVQTKVLVLNCHSQCPMNYDGRCGLHEDKGFGSANKAMPPDWCPLRAGDVVIRLKDFAG